MRTCDKAVLTDPRRPKAKDVKQRHREPNTSIWVLIRNRYVREDTGTHETLKILDDSLIDTKEETGIDPYNTGRFDRSKNWDKGSRS